MRAATAAKLMTTAAVVSTALAFGARPDAAHFIDTTSLAGIRYVHQNGASPEKFLPETMAGGAVLFDYDNDGWIDVFLVNSGSISRSEGLTGVPHRLYHNDQGLKFTDATSGSGIHPSAFGMGACAADYDNDGMEDLYVTSVGANNLYRNIGAGRFADVTSAAGVSAPVWSSSCAFADVDNDGDLDLYVANYLDWSPGNNKYCGEPLTDIRTYCPPSVYAGVPDILYRNNGDGTFDDVSREAGIYRPGGKGLGIVFGDYDNDGWVDLYVANDLVPNYLFHNKGAGVFEEVGLWAGVAVGINGQPLSGMGVDMADSDGDERLDIFVTNLDRQTHSLYRNLGESLFENVTFESGIAEATLPFVGFGAAFVDYDNDGDLDLAIANGDVLDNAGYFRPGAGHGQRNLLLESDGRGHFHDARETAGPGFEIEKVSRALVAGDLDNDGDLDLLIANNGQAADVLRNDGGRNNALLIHTVGVESNRDGVGARLRLTVGKRTLLRDVKGGSSYLGQHDRRVHFGLGAAPGASRLEIRWPSGTVDICENLGANQVVTIAEGKGIVQTQPLHDK